MLPALWVAKTGLSAQDTNLTTISNNLANVNTTGFKKDRADFETLAYQQIVQAGANSDAENKFATGLNLGSGVALQGTSKINTQGTLTQTSNTLDMAIEGSGYFQVQHDRHRRWPAADPADHRAPGRDVGLDRQ